MSNKKILVPVNKETVNSRDFLAILETRRNDIKKSRFIPPKLGSNNGFGYFEIEYKYSKLKEA